MSILTDYREAISKNIDPTNDVSDLVTYSYLFEGLAALEDSSCRAAFDIDKENNLFETLRKSIADFAKNRVILIKYGDKDYYVDRYETIIKGFKNIDEDEFYGSWEDTFFNYFDVQDIFWEEGKYIESQMKYATLMNIPMIYFENEIPYSNDKDLEEELRRLC